MRTLASLTVAKVRQQAQVGSSPTPSATTRSVARWWRAIGAGGELKTGARHAALPPSQRVSREIAGRRLRRACRSPRRARRAATRSSRSASACSSRPIAALQIGINPEVEIGRFLTDVARFRNSVPVAGSVEYVGDGRPHDHARPAAGLRREPGRRLGVHAQLSRPGVRAVAGTARSRRAPASNLHGGYLALIRTLGRANGVSCTLRCATRTGDPAFDPEPIAAADVAAWTSASR